MLTTEEKQKLDQQSLAKGAFAFGQFAAHLMAAVMLTDTVIEELAKTDPKRAEEGLHNLRIARDLLLDHAHSLSKVVMENVCGKK